MALRLLTRLSTALVLPGLLLTVAGAGVMVGIGGDLALAALAMFTVGASSGGQEVMMEVVAWWWASMRGERGWNASPSALAAIGRIVGMFVGGAPAWTFGPTGTALLLRGIVATTVAILGADACIRGLPGKSHHPK